MEGEVQKIGIHSIRTKLLIGFFGFVCLYAVGTVLSLRSITALRNLNSVSPVLVKLLAEVNVYSERIHELDQGIDELFIADYPSRRSAIRETLNDLEQTGQSIDAVISFLGLTEYGIHEDARRVRSATEDFLAKDLREQGVNESISRVYSEIRFAVENRDRLFVDSAAFSERVARERAAILDTLVLELALIGLFMVLTVVGLLFFLSSSLILPLKKLSDGIENIRRGEFGKKLGIRSRDEIGQLAHVLEKTSETLKETQRLPDSILRSMKDSLFVINSEGLITEVNAAALDVVGYSKEELLGKPISLILREFKQS